MYTVYFENRHRKVIIETFTTLMRAKQFCKLNKVTWFREEDQAEEDGELYIEKDGKTIWVEF